MESFKSGAGRVFSFTRNHKGKIGLAVISLLAAKKCYDVYQYVKPLLDMKN